MNVTFSYNSSSENYLDVFYETSSTGYGSSYAPAPNGIVHYFYAKVNVAELGSYSDNFFRGTANHELGHVMGLDHFIDVEHIVQGREKREVIMDTTRNRNRVYTPTIYDYNGVNAAFSR